MKLRDTRLRRLTLGAPSSNKPMFYLAKDKKLLKRSLSSLIIEHRDIQNMFRPRKNSGVRGMPKCVHNRIKRLESMIEHKGKLLAEAIAEKNDEQSQ